MLRSVTHSMTKSVTHSRTYSVIYSFTLSVIHCRTRIMPHSVIHGMPHRMTHCVIRKVIHSVIHSNTHSITHSITHSATDIMTDLFNGFIAGYWKKISRRIDWLYLMNRVTCDFNLFLDRCSLASTLNQIKSSQVRTVKPQVIMISASSWQAEIRARMRVIADIKGSFFTSISRKNLWEAAESKTV